MSDEPARLTELRVDIARRLRNVCAAMPEDEFDTLIQRIAQTEYKYEQRDAVSKGGPRRRPRHEQDDA
jgi:hypothetical protein